MNTKNNRQFRDSARRMENVMLELMNRLPFEKITVRLICEKAGVNRSTFYAHYTDIYDMVEQMETHLQKELMAQYPVPGQTQPLSLESFLPFLEFIRMHRDFYRVALRTRREFPIRQGQDPLYHQVIRPLCERSGVSSEEEMMYYFVGFQAGFTMILKRWVDQDCAMEVTDLARIIQNTIPRAMRGPNGS